MARTVRRVVVLLAVFFGLVFLLFLVNQTVALAALAGQVQPVLGEVLPWVVVLLYGLLLAVPAFLLLRRPPPLVPRASAAPEEIARYVRRFGRRLRDSPYLAGRPIHSRADLQEGLGILDVEADHVARATASHVFVTSAISQHGSVEAIVVLIAQARMVFRIAGLYYVRPRLRELLHLCRGVVATGFLASELEELEVTHDAQPLLSSVLGAAAGAVPGLQLTAGLLVSALMKGSANAFMTLRLAMIAKAYCRAMSPPVPAAVRRAALEQARPLLGPVVREGAATVAGRVWQEARQAVGHTLAGLEQYIRSNGSGFADALRAWRRRPEY
ncbi:MAG: hypothetical protein HY704_00475 [Gemmatimonadetes bacterium]|nr:hypothetical protein [Gemmatimonadota bacterium]